MNLLNIIKFLSKHCFREKGPRQSDGPIRLSETDVIIYLNYKSNDKTFHLLSV